eukprot:3735936-Amphidinium_carterae.1
MQLFTQEDWSPDRHHIDLRTTRRMIQHKIIYGLRTTKRMVSRSSAHCMSALSGLRTTRILVSGPPQTALSGLRTTRILDAALSPTASLDYCAYPTTFGIPIVFLRHVLRWHVMYIIMQVSTHPPFSDSLDARRSRHM